MKGRLLAALSALLIVLCPLAAAETFTVEDYHVEIDVGREGRHHIEESLDLDFHERSHGMYRDIQYLFNAIPGEFPQKAKVTDIETDTPFEVEKSDGYVSIRLGDEDIEVMGPVHYDIGYDYSFTYDQSEEYDEFYYNIVASAWDTTIDHVSYEIRFPAPVDEDMIWVTTGHYRDTGLSEGWRLSKDGMTLRGEAHDLKPMEALTLRVEMPEGYFDFPEVRSFVNACSAVFLAVGILFIVWASFAWWKWGNDDELIVPVRFTPPEGLSPVDCGFLVDGSVDFSTDILPMIFYWADRGLMTITETEDKSFSFHKLKEMDGNESAYEKKLFGWFFKEGDTVDIDDVVKGGFSEKCADATSQVRKQFEAEGSLKDRKANFHQNLIHILGILEVAAFSFLVSCDHLGSVSMFLLIPSIIMLTIDLVFSHTYFKNWNVRTKAKNVFLIILAMIPNVIGCLLLMAFLTMFGLSWPMIVAVACVHQLALIAASFIADAAEKRSEYGTKLLQDVLGYREFLSTVEVDKLERLVEEDPEYFYHNLAYAACFGLTDKYVEKFRTLAYVQPQWMYGSAMDYWYWRGMSRSYARCYMDRYVEIQAKSGGSGTSSGSTGFAGGGFSGGGGRSW